MNIEIENYFDALEDNYLLIVTSNSLEKKYINTVISNRNNLAVPLLSTQGSSIGLLDGAFVVHVTGSSGLSKENSVSRLVIELIKNPNIPKPKLVYLIGFCWGNPEKTKIGDIVISTEINSLNSIIFKGDKIEYKSIQHRSSIDLEHLAGEISDLIPTSIIGELASFEAVLASTSERDKLLEKHPRLLGGEMEAFGFIPSLEKTPWIIVKAVADFGCDNFERSQQSSAAAAAASALPQLNKILISKELIALSASKSHEIFLLDSLFGNEISVMRKDFNSDELNDYLNDKIGIIVERKLEFYLNNEGYDKGFLRYFCDLILEVLQNSLRHGGASFAKVTFHPNRITISDDGNDYALDNLEGRNGGALAWERIKSHGIDNDLVTYSFNKKSHVFEMKAASKELMEAIKNCSASIKSSTIGSGYSGQTALSYNAKCKIIYLEDSNVRMTSRRISLISEVKKLLEEGKKVYVKVSDTAYAEEYKVALKEHSNNLRILLQ